MNYKSSRGFIALISSLMLSGILLLLAAAVDLSSFLAREAAEDERSYRVAQQAAFSCARFAVSRLDSDPFRFMGTGTMSIQLAASSTCDIISASSTSDVAGVLAKGESSQSSVQIYFSATRSSSTAPFRLLTWTEY